VILAISTLHFGGRIFERKEKLPQRLPPIGVAVNKRKWTFIDERKKKTRLIGGLNGLSGTLKD